MQNILRRYTGARLRKDLKTKIALCFCLLEIKCLEVEKNLFHNSILLRPGRHDFVANEVS